MPKRKTRWDAGNQEFLRTGYYAYLSKKGPDEITREERAMIDEALKNNKMVKLPPSSALLEGYHEKSVQVSPKTR